MKHRTWRKLWSTLAMLIALVGVLTVTTLTASAANTWWLVGENKASWIISGSDLILNDDATIQMDQDLTVSSISGDHNLFITGTGTLTVTGDMDVLSVTIDTTSATVNGTITVEDEIQVFSDYFYVYGGIQAQNLARINSSHAFIAGSEYGISCEEGNIELNGSGGTLGINVGAQKHALWAKNGSILLSGDITCNITDALTYCVIAQQSIQNNYGTYLNLTVTGGSGVIANSGNIDLYVNTMDVQTDSGFAILANEGAVNITADKLVAICNGGHHGEASYPYGVGADLDVTLTVSDLSGIAGRDYGVMSRKGNISLLGNGYYFIGALGNDHNGNCVPVCALKGNIITECDLRLVSDKGEGIRGNLLTMIGDVVVEAATYGIYANELNFNGNLTVEAETGIYGKTMVSLCGDAIDIQSTGTRSCGIRCEGQVYLDGNVTVQSNGWYGIYAETDLTLKEGYYAIGGAKSGAQAIKVNRDLYMATVLQFREPEGAYLQGNDICDGTGIPTKDVVICPITDPVSVYTKQPLAGLTPQWDASVITGLPANVAFQSIIWYEDDEIMSVGASFRSGSSYRAKLVLIAQGSYRFPNMTEATVNGSDFSATLFDSNKQVRIDIELGNCPTAISNVELTITAPVEGNTPAASAYGPAGSVYGVYSGDVTWMVSDDGRSYTTMTSGTKFVGGKYYKVYMDVHLSNNNYTFLVTDRTGSVMPDVTASINSGRATVTKVYEESPEEAITLCYDFGICNDYIIEEIHITDIVTPVVGAYPTYTANIRGTGYRVDTSRNSYYDDWQNDRKLYYLKNGISWWDVTDGGYEYVYENDVFQMGHTYRCEVYVCTESGYEFVMDLYTNPETWPAATMNGAAAELTFSSMSSLTSNQEVACDFACGPMPLSNVMLYNLDAPEGGKEPDYVISVAYPDLYHVERINWMDPSGNYVEGVFQSGTYYQVMIVVSAEQRDGLDLVQFGNDLTVYLNGEAICAPSMVYLVDNQITIYYQFPEPAAEPEIVIPFATHLEIRNYPRQLTYQQGEELDLTGLQVVVVYSDGHEEYIDDYTVKGYNPWYIGTQTVCLSWNGLTASFRVTVEDPKTNTITGQPQDVNADSGYTAQFTVYTTPDAVSFKWQYRKIYKWFDTTMDGYNTSTLNVAANGGRHGYDYRCVVTFADGTVIISEPAKLTVNTYITNIQNPNDQTVVLGYKGQFTAHADGEGIKYQWQYKRPDGTAWIDTAMEGCTKPTVLIETTVARDGYQYRCEITDVTGNVVYTEPATMRVLSIVLQPQDAFTRTNSVATFMVDANVSEGISYQWQYSKNGTTWTNTTMSGYNTNTLTVTATKARNGYMYRCVLTGSKNTKIESKAATMYVGDPVVISEQPQTVRCSAGVTAVFTVTASSAYSYQWQYMSPSMSNWRNTTAEGNQTPTLHVGAKASNNGYKYRCVIQGLDGDTYYTEYAVLTVG